MPQLPGGDPGQSHGGGGGGHPKPKGEDVGARAIGVCQAGIGLTAATFFLESAGVIEAYKGVKAAYTLAKAANFASSFSYSVPAAIQQYTKANASAAYRTLASGYLSGWGQISAISYVGEAAGGFDHTWLGYVPIPYFATVSIGRAAIHACFSR